MRANKMADPMYYVLAGTRQQDMPPALRPPPPTHTGLVPHSSTCHAIRIHAFRECVQEVMSTKRRA